MLSEGRSLAYCVLLAVLAVTARVLLCDHAYLLGERIPSHDMAQGLGFFTTSMHSLRLSGDLAWWNPASLTGYAQYYQAQIGPLAPTYGHVVFIGWSHVVAILGSAGIAVPEYLQYVVVNYLVLPFLAFLAFAYFCVQFLRHRSAIALAVTVYALSGIGLWNSAWFYFQEAGSLFFLLGTSIALLRRPGPGRWLAWLAAALVQLASFNYWTVYNLFFIAIVLGAYALAHTNQCTRLVWRTRAMTTAHRPATVAVVLSSALVIGMWTALTWATVRDQAANNVRLSYTADDALARIGDLATYTTELFNPVRGEARSGIPGDNPIHSARYIGIVLLPLIALGALAGPARRRRWLLGGAILVFAICLGSPFAVRAWSAIPYMDRIVHVFYFYTHHWQLLLALLAAAGLDVLLSSRAARGRRRHLAGFAGLAILVVALVDLSIYFHDASRADMAFTAQRPWQGVIPSRDQRAALYSAWKPLEPVRFAGALDESMPLRTEFWPDNIFMLPPPIAYRIAAQLGAHARRSAPFAYYDGAIGVGPGGRLPPAIDLEAFDAQLRVASPTMPATGTSRRVVDGFAYRWKSLRYNDFEVEIDAPVDGWLMVRQLHDPQWRVTIDDRPTQAVQANYVASAVPLARGHHVLAMEYRPRTRSIYWVAAALLEAVVAVYLAAAWRARTVPSRTIQGPVSNGAPVSKS